MNLSIRCHGCNHSFRRTAAQVLADDRCPHCSSRDIDLDESETHTRTAGHGEAGSCEICGQAIRPGPVKGTFVHYDSMMELAHSAEANAATLSWYGENAPEYLTAALTEPNDAPGTQTCPGCGTANYDGSTCSNCGYTPEDYTKDATRKTAQWFDDRATKQWYQQYLQGMSDSGSGPYQAVQAIGAPGYAVVNLDTDEIVSSGNSWYDRASGAEEDAQRWNANPALAPDTSGGNDFSGLIPTASREPRYAFAAKVNAITSDVLASNPGMQRSAAQAIASETLRRYPAIFKRR